MKTPRHGHILCGLLLGMTLGTAAVADDLHHHLKPRLLAPAVCQPLWGYHQTCWSQFPAVPPCPADTGCQSCFSNAADGDMWLTPDFGFSGSLVPHPTPQPSSELPARRSSGIRHFGSDGPEPGVPIHVLPDGRAATEPPAANDSLPSPTATPSQPAIPTYPPRNGSTPLPPLPSPMPMPAPGTPTPQTSPQPSPMPQQSRYQMFPSAGGLVAPTSPTTGALRYGGIAPTAQRFESGQTTPSRRAIQPIPESQVPALQPTGALPPHAGRYGTTGTSVFRSVSHASGARYAVPLMERESD